MQHRCLEKEWVISRNGLQKDYETLHSQTFEMLFPVSTSHDSTH